MFDIALLDFVYPRDKVMHFKLSNDQLTMIQAAIDRGHIDYAKDTVKGMMLEKQHKFSGQDPSKLKLKPGQEMLGGSGRVLRRRKKTNYNEEH